MVIVLVMTAVGLVYFFDFYVPQHNVVTTQGGSWIINGASSSLGISAGCSNCGQKPVPGSQFTIDVNIGVSSQSCIIFCSSYTIESISVNGPYTLDGISPNNLPYSESEGSFNTWALTITAPGSSGHFPLGGVVGVSYD
ncbi:MAG TPA: hypothetical protein VMI55_05920 [Thermoplasmata archaeon]|nr:hypothetical protein [Thermoplasmata archaeon]